MSSPAATGSRTEREVPAFDVVLFRRSTSSAKPAGTRSLRSTARASTQSEVATQDGACASGM